jgi:two-component system phosphate regulon sensor histidine kinase PhoR
MVRPAFLIALPALFALAVLAALHVLDAGYAFVAAVVVFAGAFVIARLALRDVATLRGYAEAVATAPEARLPRLALPGLLLPLAAAIRRIGRGARSPLAETQAAAPGRSVLDMLPDPLILLDGERRVVSANAAARELLGPSAVGRDLASVLRNPALLEAVEEVMNDRAAISEAEFAFHVPVERNFNARVARLGEGNPGQPALAVALYELTAIRRTEEMRTDFIANASHELRTPVSVLLGCVQTLRGSARDDPEAQAEFFGLMEGQALRMSRLVDDLLALSRIELNEHTPLEDDVDLAKLIGQVTETLAARAREMNMSIEVDIPADIPVIRGDKDDLIKVFQNLIDNAVKYGADGTPVTVRARLMHKDIPPAMAGVRTAVAVAVEDRGEGIPPEHVPRLTERFYRVDTARSRQLGGTGLGLAIVKHVLNRHRGALVIDSKVGRGSTFSVYLPLVAATPRALPAPSGGAENGEAD